MTTINDWFGRVFVINLRRRADRMDQFREQADAIGLKFERFEAYSNLVHDGRVSGGFGCTSSHRALLEIIAYHKIDRALILEDDAAIIHPDTQQKFSDAIGHLPADWGNGGMFLGAHYAEKPHGLVNPYWVKAKRVLTTHAYGVSWQSARAMAPYIGGAGGAIDSQYGRFHEANPWYVIEPRLFKQRKGFSDLEERMTDYEYVYSTNRHTWGNAIE